MKDQLPQSLPTPSQYATALRQIQITDVQRSILLAHYNSPDYAATARRLARASGLNAGEVINAQYGRLGTKLRKQLGYQGAGQQSSIIASFLQPGLRGNTEWLWVMHPQMATAIKLLGWACELPHPSKGSVHVCFGDPDVDLDTLRAASTDGRTESWTINDKSIPGDRAVFYMVAPLSSFVATGTVASVPTLNHGNKNWPGLYRADIDDIKMLSSPVHLHVARKALPDWGWLRAPRRSISVPSKVVAMFLSLLKAMPQRAEFGLESDIEGTKTEVLRLTTKRSRRLRDTAFIAAKGLCSVCDRDFSLLLEGRGVRVLQVHHRKQLSAFEMPRRTKLNDLAVVCANCHALLHLDSDAPLRVEELRRMLKRDLE
jgi:hypothetical protein